MFDISVNMVVRNEAERLSILLPQLRSLFREIIVVDQSSTDNTVDIAQRYCDMVVLDKNHGFCEPSRQLCKEISTCKWLLVLDADEQPSYEFYAKLPRLLKQDDIDAYSLNYMHIVYGEDLPSVTLKEITATFPPFEINSQNKIRLLKKEFAIFSPKLHTGPQCSTGKVGSTNSYADIFHFKSSYEWNDDNQRYHRLIK